MIARETENEGMQRICYRTRKVDLEGLNYRVFPEDMIMECSVLRALVKTARELMRMKVVDAKATQCNAAQQAALTRLESSIAYYKTLTDNLRKQKDNSSSNKRCGAVSPRLRMLRSKSKTKKWIVRVLCTAAS